MCANGFLAQVQASFDVSIIMYALLKKWKFRKIKYQSRSGKEACVELSLAKTW